ncbi:uncharacterized protein LOC114265298 [Camellia sinensis]|uniref:uncharacterized protein LOC114265298 n=1 Tax=Camellia sinensis TaxID=4442 RepID=UPI001035665B|nr:uncharacterized protein LOC114265298 [Camellia sinensis]
MEYVDGRIQAPNTIDPGYDQWEITNSLIMGWLIHSMVQDIGEGYLSMETAQDVWDDVAATYSCKGNFSQAFELRHSIESSVQGEQTDYKPVCTADSVGYKKFIAQERVFKFLAGLNVEYDPVRSRVLSMDTLSSLQEAFAYVQNEKSRRSAMMSPISTDRSALLSTSRDSLSLTPIPPSAAKKSVFCDYCKKPQHTRETCWKLHGTPSGGRGDRSGSRGGQSGQSRGRGSYPRAHQSSVVDTLDSTSTSIGQASNGLSSMTTHELEDVLHHLLDHQSSTALSTSSLSFARSGNLVSSSCVFLSHTTLPWIINSSTSDHMSGSSDLFSSYKPSLGQDKVRIADGTISSISGKGLVHATPTLPLSSVLHVYLMKDKSDVFSVFLNFHKMICTQFGVTVKIFRSDNGDEYIDSGLGQYFSTHGIIHQISCTNTPQQNEVAERKNRHLLDMARCMCFSMSVPRSYWGDDVLTAAHLINHLPTQVLQKQAPLQVLLSSPSLFPIPPKIFGCLFCP